MTFPAPRTRVGTTRPWSAGLVAVVALTVVSLAACSAGGAAPQVTGTAPLRAGAGAANGPTGAPGPTGVPGSTSPGSTSPVGSPLVGECRGPTTSATIEPASDPRPTVPCAGSHGAETVYVGTLPADVTAWPGANNDIGADLQATISAACRPALADYLGTPIAVDGAQTLTSVDLAFYVPTEQQFTEGDRWFRCDAVLYPFPGQDQTIIPGTLKGALANPRPSPDLLVCEGAAGDRLPCSVPHRAELLEVVELRDAADAPYPGSTALGAKVDKICRARVVALLDQRAELRNDLTLLDYPPPEGSWVRGDRSAYCGVAVVANELVSGTLRGLGTGKLPVGGIQA